MNKGDDFGFGPLFELRDANNLDHAAHEAEILQTCPYEVTIEDTANNMQLVIGSFLWAEKRNAKCYARLWFGNGDKAVPLCRQWLNHNYLYVSRFHDILLEMRPSRCVIRFEDNLIPQLEEEVLLVANHMERIDVAAEYQYVVELNVEIDDYESLNNWFEESKLASDQITSTKVVVGCDYSKVKRRNRDTVVKYRPRFSDHYVSLRYSFKLPFIFRFKTNSDAVLFKLNFCDK